MASKKEKKSESKGLVKKEAPMGMESVMNHPAVKDLRAQLSAVKQMLESLPEAIGKAVAAAQQQQTQAQVPAGANGPAMEMLAPKNVEIRKGSLNLDGTETKTKEDVIAFYLQPTPSFPGAPQRESYDPHDDVEFLRAVKDYQAEWRKKYNCRGCLDVACPQCGHRQQQKAKK